MIRSREFSLGFVEVIHLLNKMSTVYDKTKKIWINLDENSLNSQEMSLGQQIFDSLTTYGSSIAQISDDTGVRMTYHEMRLKSIRAAQNLQKMGFKSRQKFGFIANNSDDVVPILLASLFLSCPTLPLHTMLKKKEIVRFLGKTKPAAIFCDASAYEKLGDALKELKMDVKVFTFGGNNYDLESVGTLFAETSEEDSFVPVKVTHNEVANISCSSGTTGSSKYVCLPYIGLSYKPSKSETGNIMFSFDSIFWTTGIAPILSGIYNGMTRIITTKPFSPDLQLKLIEKYKVTFLLTTPPREVACLKSDAIHKADLSSVKTMISTGCKIPCNIISDINRYYTNAKMCSCYATTEIGAISVSVLDARTEINRSHLISGHIAKIIDDQGNHCGPNLSGEILIKPKHPFLGYLDDPIATAAAIDDQGFYRTGDNGHFDENGMLIYEERKVDVIKVFHFRGVILPSEIEEYLIKMPDIEEVCIVGIPIVSSYTLPAAVIVRNPNSNLSQLGVFHMIAENFRDGAKPRGGVYFVDSLPKTHSGKTARREVTKMATEMFKAAKDSDPDILSFLSEIPDELRRVI